ncbi:hypothetical protein Q7P37_005287 [Cladosporium fusiforme]
MFSHNALKSLLGHLSSMFKAVVTHSGIKAAAAETKVTTGNTILLTALLIITAWFSQATFAPPSKDSEQEGTWKVLASLGISSTLTILRILQGTLSTMSSLMLLNSFDMVVWMLAKRGPGLQTLRLLSLSSTTGLWGTMEAVFSPKIDAVGKIFAASKLALLAMTWLSGILLFARTQITTVNRTAHTCDVIAGVGPFRGSYVEEYLRALQELNDVSEARILPYSIMMTASQMIINPIHSWTAEPVECEGSRSCDSYLLPGGLSLATPWPPTGYDGYPTITVHEASATQLDFQRVTDQKQSFDDSVDCTLYGSIGFDIGLFVCQNGTANGTCHTSIIPPQLVVNLTAYQRRATVTCARSNLSIVAVHDLSPPIEQADLDIDALKRSFTWLTNATAADIPFFSSVAQFFWTSWPTLNDEHFSGEPYRLFQSLLAFPFWHFNDNNYGNIELDPTVPLETLPQEFHTVASVDKPMNKIVVDRGMLIAFCVLQSTCVAWVWIALWCRWIFHRDMPNMSSYPMVDFAFKSHQRHREGDGIAQPAIDVSADNAAIRESFRHVYTAVSGAKRPVSTEQSTESLAGADGEGQQRALLEVQEVEIRMMHVQDERPGS